MGMKHWKARPARNRRSGRFCAALLAVTLLTMGLAGCALNASVANPTPAATASNDNSGTPGAHPTLTLPTLTPAASPSGPAGPGGAGEFCSKAASVMVHPGANIPAYPGANLHYSQANGSNSFFGFCSSASTSDIQNFYSLQLPRSGWTGLQTSTIAAVVQINASQCTRPGAPQIIVTIAPDATGTTTTSVSIVVLAGTC